MKTQGPVIKPPVRVVIGVDFSGARLAGRNCWVATCDVPQNPDDRLRLTSLTRLERLAGTAERDQALGTLVRTIAASDATLWAIDFPFGLPIEVLDHGEGWDATVRRIATWPDGAAAFGRACVATATARGLPMHVRRTTDVETRTPFDCYHYRIVYQMFHGIRDVLMPLRGTSGTAILPFDLDRLASAKRVVVEACPGSTLRRLGWPYRNYKQPAGGPLTPLRRRNRREIVDRLLDRVDVSPTNVLRAMRDGGADALDAILAAAGGWESWRGFDLTSVAAHPRYTREGLIFA